jgi:hypothetical protein
MTDRHVEGLGIFAGKRHDLADHFRRKRRWRTTTGRIAQTRRDPSGWHCFAPPTPPVTGRLAPNPQLLRGFIDPQAGCRQQDNPSPFRQLLRRRMRPHQIVQLPFMLSRQVHR